MFILSQSENSKDLCKGNYTLMINMQAGKPYIKFFINDKCPYNLTNEEVVKVVANDPVDFLDGNWHMITIMKFTNVGESYISMYIDGIQVGVQKTLK